ncbi:hypothetical protein ACFVTF_16035 [Kitasatospora sp. NPDC057940]|uniref:hypothetical protein n=1 Tax=Kitasatospora sp. NPDC057940 TaxID=3346285 RepID=UPI0036DDD53D
MPTAGGAAASGGGQWQHSGGRVELEPAVGELPSDGFTNLLPGWRLISDPHVYIFTWPGVVGGR